MTIYITRQVQGEESSGTLLLIVGSIVLGIQLWKVLVVFFFWVYGDISWKPLNRQSKKRPGSH